MAENMLLSQAVAAQRRGDLAGAIEILGRVVESNPQHWLVWRGLAGLLFATGYRTRAIEHMEAAVAGLPTDPVWFMELGNMLEADGRFDRALEVFRTAERLSPKDARFPGCQAMLLRRMRDEEGARAACERAIALDPNQHRALLALTQTCLKTGELDRAEASARRLIDHGPDPLTRATAWHLLGRVLEKRGAYAEAFETHLSGNKLKLATPRAGEMLRLGLIPFAPFVGHGDGPARYRAWGEKRYDDGIPAPIIVTGFPRSGTTMAEQILAAHPRLATCEERPLCMPVREALDGMLGGGVGLRPLLEALDALNDDQVRRLRSIYRAELERGVAEGDRGLVLVDKLPVRVLDLGLMNRIFPEARVIVMIRDPRDVCLSALFQDFAINRFMVRFLTPALCAEFYERMMGFWLKIRGMLSMQVLEVRYEDVVGDFDRWSRRMIECAGVEWDPRVSEFHKPAQERIIRSASFDAVTERVHTRAVGRWRRYETQLAPILGRLEPFVAAFGYEPSSGSAPGPGGPGAF